MRTAGAGMVCLGPGDVCFVNNAKAYDDVLSDLLRPSGGSRITPDNTLFIINAEENDHFAGGTRTGRPHSPTPAG